LKNTPCLLCGSIEGLVKNGKDANHKQRYKCKACLRTYIIDKTPSKHLKLSDYKLKQILAFMVDDVTLEVIARNLKINIRTVLYYRYIIFKALENYQDQIKLDGIVIIDETFISIREKEYIHTRPDGKGIRGLSFNQLCIVTMVNIYGISVAKVTSRAMPLPEHYIKLFTNNIKNIEKFIHDGNTKAYQFMNQFNVEKINGKKDESGKYSIIMVDNYHSILKRFLYKHSGYKLKNIQHYLNFFTYRQNYLAYHNIKNMSAKIKIKNKMINSLFRRVKNTEKVVSFKDFLTDQGIKKIMENR
jgi:transposase-like protein